MGIVNLEGHAFFQLEGPFQTILTNQDPDSQPILQGQAVQVLLPFHFVHLLPAGHLAIEGGVGVSGQRIGANQ